MGTDMSICTNCSDAVVYVNILNHPGNSLSKKQTNKTNESTHTHPHTQTNNNKKKEKNKKQTNKKHESCLLDCRVL